MPDTPHDDDGLKPPEQPTTTDTPLDSRRGDSDFEPIVEKLKKRIGEG